MNILFVCSANKNRSKTAECYLSEIYFNHTFSSAGTNKKLCFKNGTEFITEEMIIDADMIFVMEQKHFDLIKEHTNSKYASKTKVLNIPDFYEFWDKELKELILEKTKVWLNQ